MSYDLHLSLGTPPPEEEVLASMGAPLSAEDRALADRAAAALCAAFPALRAFPGEQGVEVFAPGATEDDPPRNGFDISLYGRTAAITVPYWYAGAEAARVFDELWGCLRVLAGLGYRIEDAQLGRDLDVDSRRDRDEALAVYATMVRKIPSLMADLRRKKPWWKLW